MATSFYFSRLDHLRRSNVAPLISSDPSTTNPPDSGKAAGSIWLATVCVPTADAVAAPASNIRERVQAKEENFFMIYPSPSFISCRRQSFLSADRPSHLLIYLPLSTIFAKQSCGKTDAYGIISDLLCKSLQEISSALPVSTEEEARSAPRHDCKAIENTRRELPAPGRRSLHGLCALARKLHIPII